MTNQRLCLFTCVIVASALYSSCGESVSEEIDGPGFFSAIYSDNILSGQLTFDLDSLVFYKDAETDTEVDGTLDLFVGDSTLSLPVELRSRGVTRRNLCAFPPIRLQVKRKALRAHGWGPYRNYKLVTHCSDTTAVDDLLLREYLIYKMYEVLSEYSLRTQLLRLRYHANDSTSEHFAFLIENVDEMNDRLKLTELDVQATGLQRIHFDHYKRFALFQYMVANTDWNLGTSHNTKFVLTEGSETPIVIPYDFDYCGLVNAPYARPFETLPIDSVRQRYFMYRGKKSDDFVEAIEEFKAHRPEWIAMISTFSHLSQESRHDMVEYITGFFETIEDPEWKEALFPS